MNKWLKRLLILLVVVLLLLVLAAAGVFLLYPLVAPPDEETPEDTPEPAEAAEELEKVDLDESSGMLYVNNEVVVFVDPAASQEEIAALFAQFDAETDDTMADIGVYKLIFTEAMSYDELQEFVDRLEKEPIVESASVNPVAMLDADDADSEDDEDDFDYQDAVFPNDEWNGASWDVEVPRNENWGMEAIDAPGAWGYLDQVHNVKIGLIDAFPNTSHNDLSFAGVSCLFVNEDNGKTSVNTYELAAEDHGSHVSGIMNAKWNNDGEGVSGVMGGKGETYYCSVSYVSNGQVYDKYATAYSYLLALKTLIDQDVQVINISQNTCRLIGFAASHGNQNAVRYLSAQADMTQKGLLRIIAARQVAGRPDFVICVAAGNSNNTYYYPDENAPYGYREEMTDSERAKYLSGWRGERGNSLAKYNNFLNLMDEEAVKDRVIVVGAVGISESNSTATHTRYKYENFSNVGDRVDIVAPGRDVYSCYATGYDLMSGTSMSTPHVSGAAGLVFGCNPALTGPQVKQILKTTATGRYYHGDAFSGLLNVNNAVVLALKTVEDTPERVLKNKTVDGLDLCFVVDTTGSMGDDIDNAKENMTAILEHLASKTENYRVALIDYRDFASRTSDTADYPSKVELTFTNSNDSILKAINALDLGSGGDDEETVYSALMSAVDLEWREDAKKVIIILGDAAPLDPEPITGYTYDDVLLALFRADINLDYEASDERVVDSMDISQINVFSIGTDASDDAEDFFREISEGTGGSYAGVEDASQVGDAIISSIEQIKVEEPLSVRVDFGDEMANETIDLYSGRTFLFTLETDENGQFTIEDIEPDTYRWTSSGLYGGGSLEVESDNRNAAVRVTRKYWFTPALSVWHRHAVPVCAGAAAYLALCAAVPVSLKRRRRKARKKAAAAAVPAYAFQTAAPLAAETPAAVPAPAPAEMPVPEETPAPDGGTLLCPNCGAAVSAGERFCGECGYALEETPAAPAEQICPHCGTHCQAGARFCKKCGTRLDG